MYSCHDFNWQKFNVLSVSDIEGEKFWENPLLISYFHYHYDKQAIKVAPVANAWAPRYIATGNPAPVAAALIADAPAANDVAL